MVEADSSIAIKSQPLYFEVGGVQLFAKRFGVKGGHPVIALHGWMDNCASLDLLAPELEGCDVLCIDCAGHGRSGHRKYLGAYNIWQDVAELFCIADQLGWQQFSLLGHSRGGICSFLAAGTLPERITHLVLIEGVYPPVGTAENTPETLATAVKSLLVSQNRPKRYYETFEQAVAARAKGLVPISMEDAKLLALHGTDSCKYGYFWRTDYQLVIGSEVRFSKGQVMAFQANISAKTLVILAEEGMFINEPNFMSALATFHDAHVVVLPGGHHLHMNQQYEIVAQHILTYILD